MSTKIKTLVISIPLLLISIFLVYKFSNSIHTELDTRDKRSKIKNAIVNRLKLIRDVQIAYKTQYGKYASWSQLKEYANSGKFYIIEANRTFETQDDGTEKVRTTYDTVKTESGEPKTISVKDSIVNKYTVKLNDLAFKKKEEGVETLETKFLASGEEFTIPFTMEIASLDVEDSEIKIPVIEVIAINPKMKKGEQEIKFGSISENVTTGNWDFLAD